MKKSTVTGKPVVALSLPKIDRTRSSSNIKKHAALSASRSRHAYSSTSPQASDETELYNELSKVQKARGHLNAIANPSLLAALSISRLSPEAKNVVTELSALSQATASDVPSNVDMISSQTASNRILQKLKDIGSKHEAVSPSTRTLKLVYERVASTRFPTKNTKEFFCKSIRLVMYQLDILRMISRRYKPENCLEVRAVEDFVLYAKNPFNKDFFMKRFHIILSGMLMYVMNKEPEERSVADINMVKDFMSRMHIRPILHLMDGRSQAVKKHFARILRFMRVPAGRVIVRQGHTADSIYLLVKGEVAVLYTNYDKSKDEVKASVVALERDGYDFGAGEEGFHHIRLNTVVSKETCDIVWIDKEDYLNLTEVIDEVDRETSMLFLQQVLPSTLRDEPALQLCLRHCVYQEYPPDTEIKVNEFLDSRGRSRYVFFVYNGVCLQYRTLYLLSKVDKYGNNTISLDICKHDEAKMADNNKPVSDSPIKLPLMGKPNKEDIVKGKADNVVKFASNTSLPSDTHAEKPPAFTSLRKKAHWGSYCKSMPMQGERLVQSSKSVTFKDKKQEEPETATSPQAAEKASKLDKPKKATAISEEKPGSFSVTRLSKVLPAAEYFGVGETHRNTTYRTPKGQPTEFIVIPRDAFESKISLNHQLYMMTNRLTDNRQTSPQLYRGYKRDRLWIDYKKDVLEEATSRPKPAALAKHLGHNFDMQTSTKSNKTIYRDP